MDSVQYLFDDGQIEKAKDLTEIKTILMTPPKVLEHLRNERIYGRLYLQRWECLLNDTAMINFCTLKCIVIHYKFRAVLWLTNLHLFNCCNRKKR